LLALFLQNKAKQSKKNIMAGRPLGRSCCLLGLGGASLAVPGGHGRVERACSRPAPTPAGGTCPPPPHVAYPGEKRVAPSSSSPKSAHSYTVFLGGAPAQAKLAHGLLFFWNDSHGLLGALDPVASTNMRSCCDRSRLGACRG